MKKVYFTFLISILSLATNAAAEFQPLGGFFGGSEPSQNVGIPIMNVNACNYEIRTALWTDSPYSRSYNLLRLPFLNYEYSVDKVGGNNVFNTYLFTAPKESLEQLRSVVIPGSISNRSFSSFLDQNSLEVSCKLSLTRYKATPSSVEIKRNNLNCESLVSDSAGKLTRSYFFGHFKPSLAQVYQDCK
jgi:hypothetical protein